MKIGEDHISSIIYHNYFDYPLTEKELEKWRMGEKGDYGLKIRDCGFENGFFFLKGREEIIKKRLVRERASAHKLNLARKYSKIFKFIPTIKFVGITGSLAMMNADKDADIDLIMICKKGTLWTTRAIILIILIILRIPIRRFGDKFQKDKLCLNIWLDESDLVWPTKERNSYTAHEIAQIIPLINKGGACQKFLWENRWILKYWPKAVEISSRQSVLHLTSYILYPFEHLAFWLQYLYMRSKITNEVISPTRAIFHPRKFPLDNLKFDSVK